MTMKLQKFSPRNEHIWNILVLAKQRQVQQNLDRFRIRAHDDHFGDTPIQRLGRFVRALLRLLIISRLLD
jgi:hypothetical protein